MQKTPAAIHPTSRGPTWSAGWATATGNTKTRRAAVAPVAAWGEMTPANSTPNPTTAIRTTDATLLVETTVPTAMKQTPTTKRPAYDSSRMRGRPGKSTSNRRANAPKAAKRLVWALEKRRWVRPNTRGMKTAARTERFTARRPGSFFLTHPTSTRPRDGGRCPQCRPYRSEATPARPTPSAAVEALPAGRDRHRAICQNHGMYGWRMAVVAVVCLMGGGAALTGCGGSTRR